MILGGLFSMAGGAGFLINGSRTQYVAVEEISKPVDSSAAELGNETEAATPIETIGEVPESLDSSAEPVTVAEVMQSMTAEELANAELEELGGMSPDVNTEVILTLNAKVNSAGVVHAYGGANLPDGAYIIWGAQHVVPEQNVWAGAQGLTQVRNGTYKFDIKATDLSKGDLVIVWITFQTIIDGVKQPDSVIEKYGEMGGRMVGHVSHCGGLLCTETEIFVTVQ